MAPSAAKGFSYLVGLQIFSRIITFALNTLLARDLGPQWYAIANVQLYVIGSTALFLAKEGLRRAGQRIYPGGAGAALTHGINVTWLSVPTTALVAALAGVYFADTSRSGGVQEIVGPDEWAWAVWAVCAAAVVEACAEPGWLYAQANMHLPERIIAEGGALTVRAGATVWLALHLRQGAQLQGALHLVAATGRPQRPNDAQERVSAAHGARQGHGPRDEASALRVPARAWWWGGAHAMALVGLAGRPSSLAARLARSALASPSWPSSSEAALASTYCATPHRATAQPRTARSEAKPSRAGAEAARGGQLPAGTPRRECCRRDLPSARGVLGRGGQAAAGTAQARPAPLSRPPSHPRPAARTRPSRCSRAACPCSQSARRRTPRRPCRRGPSPSAPSAARGPAPRPSALAEWRHPRATPPATPGTRQSRAASRLSSPGSSRASRACTCESIGKIITRECPLCLLILQGIF